MSDWATGISRINAGVVHAPRSLPDPQLLVRRYAATLLDGSPDLAERVLAEALDGGLDGPAVYAKVIAPALHWIGDRWEEGDFSIADEHLAIATTQRVVARMHARLFPVRIAGRRARVLLACVEGEHHRVGLSLISDVLAAEGFEVLELGANLPTPDLLYAVETHQPAAVCATPSPGCATVRPISPSSSAAKPPHPGC
jgi:methanogenic corrinoid protein MtbC1